MKKRTPHSNVTIIAEAGVNHNGDFELAKKLVEAAREAGADYVKFQTFTADSLAQINAPKAAYQTANTANAQENQYEMLKKLELGQEQQLQLAQYCRKIGVSFLSTPFDEASADFLEKLVPFFKVPSGEVTNLPFLEHLARKKKPLLVSTGMCTLEDVKAAKKVVESVWKKARYSSANLSFLQCTTNYPAEFSELNLRAIHTLARELKCPVGFSDHSNGIEAAVAAVAMGAHIIEKHFTLDKNLPGPDHKASLDPQQLAAMVRSIRHIEMALGDGIKRPSEQEKKNILIARKGLYYRQDFPAGHKLQASDFIRKRPCPELSPMDLLKQKNWVLKAAVKKDALAKMTDFKKGR